MASNDFYQQSTLPHLSGGKERSVKLPKEIGGYKIESLLETGGMSHLYLALHPYTRTPLVVKVLAAEYLSHIEMVDRFLQEAKIIGVTDHPNIVKLYGQGEWEGGLYIAMEFVRGISLKQFISLHQLSPRSTLDIILQVAYALLHLHTHGVIHRDLKPENILITQEGKVKVIDFGVALVAGEAPKATSSEGAAFLGTPSYMSPQQRKNPQGVTFATDIYSLGVVAFELLVGQLSGGNIQLSLLPDRLRALLAKALASNLEERYEDMVDFITAVSRYLKEEEESPESATSSKEVWVHLKEGHAALLPRVLPKWSALDIGMAHVSEAIDLTTTYDFLQLADRSYCIPLAKYCHADMEALSYLGMLKGMVQSLMRSFLSSSESLFEPIPFVTALNEMVARECKKGSFLFQLLYLSPTNNRLSFITCGGGSLAHLRGGREAAHFLSSENPPLGEDPYHAFYETTENWNEGDLLIAHLFPHEGGARFEKQFNRLLKEQLQLAAQEQATALLEGLAAHFPAQLPFSYKRLITIQRIT